MDSRNIQSEKAEAMIRYRRLRNVAKMRRLLEILVALAILSWSSTRLPLAVKLAGQFLAQYLFNPHINFVIGNAIIIVVVLISRQNNSAGNNNNSAGAVDFCDQYVQASEAYHRIISVSDGATPPLTAAEEAEAAATADDEDKQIILSENAVAQTECDAVSTAVEEAKKQIQRFQRTQSAKLKHDLRSAPRRQLRRSETVVIKSADERAITSFDTVDRLSSEEFRRTVEEYIAEHRRFQRSQKMAENNYYEK